MKDEDETGVYSRFSRDLHQKAARSRIPIEGTIEVTRRCPLSCVHCYNRHAGGPGRDEMTLPEIRCILDQVVEAGCLWLLLTGGEVFARPDALEIIEAARERGLLVTIFTNAVLIDRRIADRLAVLRPFAIEVSLYGRTRETYERVTGVPGSFERGLRGIRLLLDRGLPLRLKTMALTINRHELRDLAAFARDDLGVPFAFDGSIIAAIDGSRRPLSFRLAPEDVVEIDGLEPRRAAEWERLFGEPAPVPSDSLYRCGGGIISFAVDSEGMLRICPLSRRHGFDLRAGTFREGWSGLLKEIRSKPRTRSGECGSCRLQPLCGICPAIAELEAGDPEARLEFFCRIGRVRASMVRQAAGGRRAEPAPSGVAKVGLTSCRQ